MKNFSSVLSEYVHERKTNISALASETGIERTLLHKYISGARTPSDINTVLQLSEGLMLSDSERKILCDSYLLSSLGEEGYERRRITERIFRFLSSLPHPEFFSGTIPSEKIVSSAVSGSLSVDLMIQRIIADSSSERILIISPPSYMMTCRELVRAALYRPSLQIIQIIMFSPSDHNLNLRTLESILPLLVFCDGYIPLTDYSIYMNACCSAAMFPNIILTDSYAFCFSRYCDAGILHTRSDIIQTYKTEFFRYAEKAPGLISRKISSAPEPSENIIKINSNLFAENDDRKLSLVFRTGSYWSSILIYEQSLRNSIKYYLEQMQIKKALPEQ